MSGEEVLVGLEFGPKLFEVGVQAGEGSGIGRAREEQEEERRRLSSSRSSEDQEEEEEDLY